ncbi:hypothetical protein LG314_00920 [Agrococcus terreus]|uniref:hypothetical protein n=1 Tax=Agrococcus terreus TaxID=574649 RepID=UPI00384AB611
MTGPARTARRRGGRGGASGVDDTELTPAGRALIERARRAYEASLEAELEAAAELDELAPLVDAVQRAG